MVRIPFSKQGLSPKKDFNTAAMSPHDAALFAALAVGDLPGIEEAFAAGASKQARDESGRPLAVHVMEACSLNVGPLLRALHAQGVDLNEKGENGRAAIHIAVEKAHGLALEVLPQLGADLDLPNQHGDTPVHMATRAEKYWLAKNLLLAGASVDLDALIAAPLAGGDELLRLMLEKLDPAISVNTPGKYGYTALMSAAEMERYKEVLAYEGPDEDEVSPDTRAEIQSEEAEEIKKGKFACARLLCARGANPDQLSPERKSSIDIAEKDGFSELAAFLREVAQQRRLTRQRNRLRRLDGQTFL